MTLGKTGLSLCALAVAAAAMALPGGLAARDSLGIFGEWGAFRDPSIPRCFAIAKAAPSTQPRDFDPYASIGTWPKSKIRGQIHLRLSRSTAKNAPITLVMGGKSFTLTGSGGNAWAKDARMDAAIVAAMRSAGTMFVRSRDSKGRNFSNTYKLDGVATAMDAATVGCARLN